jgi:glycosyltransferase involved in cell wall biosynthesis
LNIIESDKTKREKITVVTINYNYGHFLEETINSVLNQNYTDLEYIIIDGGSTDQSLEIIKKYENQIKYWISERDRGWFHAMNKGIAASSGDWINFMNSGDTFASSDVLNRIDFSALKNYALVYGNTITSNIVRKPISDIVASLRKAEIFACHQSMFFNRNLLQSELYFKENYKIYNDYELVLRIYNSHNNFHNLGDNLVIANYRLGGISSKKSWRARYDKIRILYEYFGIRGVVYNLFVYLKRIATNKIER